jgi:DNA mismatch repair protein MutS
MKKENKKDTIVLTLGFSLLWPKGRQRDTVKLNRECIIDLETEKLINFLSIDSKNQEFVGDIFTLLCQDTETISYRLDIIDDLLTFPVLVSCLEASVPIINNLRYYTNRLRRDEWTPLQEVIWRLRELEHYVACVQQLGQAFRGIHHRIQSQGLKTLNRLITTIENDPTFNKLVVALPELLETINSLKSITIGVNLNEGLIPCEATLVSVNTTKYVNAPLFNKLIGSVKLKGIAPLHKAPVMDGYSNPLMIPLFKDISNIMEKMIKPITESLKAFITINSRLFVKLLQDFLFYIGAVKAITILRNSGLHMIRPDVLEKEKRYLHATGLYNINLAIQLLQQHKGNPQELKSSIVTNHFSQDDEGRIIILTGPNRGGKTTFLQAVGLTQLLMQAGMYVPAEKASISTVDSIFTHYPAREDLEKGTGRFGEEAGRLNEIFNAVTRFSLVLLNESLSSTNVGESIYLAEDIVRVLKMIGTRVMYTTHMHGLAAAIDKINRDTGGDSKVISMVAMAEKVEKPDFKNEKKLSPSQKSQGEAGFMMKPTFKIVQGPPMGQSYAIELAASFGISKDQLISKLIERGEITP